MTLNWTSSSYGSLVIQNKHTKSSRLGVWSGFFTNFSTMKRFISESRKFKTLTPQKATFPLKSAGQQDLFVRSTRPRAVYTVVPQEANQLQKIWNSMCVDVKEQHKQRSLFLCLCEAQLPVGFWWRTTSTFSAKYNIINIVISCIELQKSCTAD